MFENLSREEIMLLPLHLQILFYLRLWGVEGFTGEATPAEEEISA